MKKEAKAQESLESEERKLIKFSNYSLCVTLPKWVIKKLNWNKGDIVNMVVSENKGEILIRKNNGNSKPKTSENKPAPAISNNTSDKKARW